MDAGSGRGAAHRLRAMRDRTVSEEAQVVRCCPPASLTPLVSAFSWASRWRRTETPQGCRFSSMGAEHRDDLENWLPASCALPRPRFSLLAHLHALGLTPVSTHPRDHVPPCTPAFSIRLLFHPPSLASVPMCLYCFGALY